MTRLRGPGPEMSLHGPNLPSPLIIGLAIVGGCIIGWIVSRVSPGTGPQVDAFLMENWYSVWSSTGSAVCALWLVLAYLGAQRLRALLPRKADDAVAWRSSQLVLVVLTISFLLFGGIVTALGTEMTVQFRQGDPFPLSHSVARVNIFTAIGVAGFLPSGVGLWWVLIEARRLGRAANESRHVEADTLQAFIRYEEAAQSFLAFGGAAVAAGVAQASALRRALIGSGIIQEIDYPPEMVLLYGALFAIALAIIYLPTALTLRLTGRKICDLAALRMLPTGPHPDEISRWVELYDCRERVGKALGLHLGVWARIQLTLGLLAPVLVAMFGSIMPGKG